MNIVKWHKQIINVKTKLKQVCAAVRRLYDTVEAARSHLLLKPSSMKAIDRFLKGRNADE